MSIVQLRIELPTYGRSFSIHVPETCSILEVKQEISRICPGRPRVDGQKLIWRGRFLADEERVETIWKSPIDARIAHLSVHPSAWISGPPTVQANDITRRMFSPQPISTPTSPTPLKLPVPTPGSQSGLTSRSLPFVFAKHVEAITLLMEGRINPAGANAMPLQREQTIRLLEANGWSWPTFLDMEYPKITPGGLHYDRVTIGDVPYLSLQNDDIQPTPAQLHALRVLSYTFAILAKDIQEDVRSQLPFSSTQTTADRQTVADIPHINDLLQQMGLPPLHNGPNVDAVLNQHEQPRPANLLPDIPIRPLLAPLFMLIIRTSLLLYFVAPARKPIFGLLIVAWMVYEIWQPIRNNLLRQIQQNERAARRDGAQAPAPLRPEGPGGDAAVPGADNPVVEERPQPRVLMEMLGNMNIQTERRVLDEATQQEPMEPSLSHKLLTFFSLLVTTVHPAIWNQRRAALRSREGVVRTEVNMRNAQRRTDLEDEEAIRNEIAAEESRRALRERHARRPRWIQRYIERVVDAEWVDDAD